MLWHNILDHMKHNQGHYFIFGDFNVDVPLGGHLFTRTNNRGDKLSKLDRFLITEHTTSLLHNSSAQEELLKKIKEFDDTNARRTGDFVIGSQRVTWLSELRSIELKEYLDYSQKAKIKWGQWLSDPIKIKDAFYSSFNSKFQRADVARIVNRSPFYRSLNANQNSFLASSTCETKIRDAVWDCGSDKSPGPNGFTFAFYKKSWDTIKKDLVGFVQDFFSTGTIPHRCNASFIALIPKVPNPMVISDFRPISLIGAQYKIIAKVLANRLAKVIDSIIGHEQSAFIKNRQILDGPLMSCFMRFNDTWIKWISGCLFYATSSILINGSPTCEFNINRGLRQGDPLSPFLFIIAMEGLHVALEDALAAGLYRCLPIDCNMANVKNWDPIVDKFSKRLSKWKSSMLSIGGRATFISSVLGSIGTYYFSLFPIPITVSKKLESIRSHFFGEVMINLKDPMDFMEFSSSFQRKHGSWYWQPLFFESSPNSEMALAFFNNPNSLWVRLLTYIHGDIDDASSFLNHVGSQGVWGRIECLIRDCWNNGWRLEWSRSISSGSNATNIANLYSQLANYSLNDSEDDWSWAIGMSSITVKTTREHIDQRYLPNDGMETRWNRFLPKKINIFIWRALHDRLPTRWNLSRKGIDVDSLPFPVCDAGIETIQHSLWFCSLATIVWHRIFVWLHITPPMLSNIQDFYSWIDDLHISSSRRTILDTICSVVLWTLWNFRNETTFGTTPPKRCTLIDKIVDFSYSWYSSRNNLYPVTWNNWLENPLEVSTL
nr:RNA-directed DNA polymerase, eukaryota [Tanacetum cinerariifolium]